ncbi:MAG: ATP-binding protein [Polyangiaceae bacterium]|nr:ATP-binding protein [Polyangiaceae bacterium]
MPADGRHRIPLKIGIRIAALARAEARQVRIGAIHAALSSVHSSTSDPLSVTKIATNACKALITGGAFAGAWAGRIQGHQLHILTAAGNITSPPPDSLSRTPDCQAWVQAISSQQPVLLLSNAPPQHRDVILAQLGCSTGLYIPIQSQHDVYGVLCVGTNNPSSFDRDTIAMLVELGRAIWEKADRIVTDRTLATQRELLRAVFECTTYGIYYATAEGEIRLCNDAYTYLVARPREEIVGAHYQKVSSPNSVESESAVVQGVLSSRDHSEYDKEVVRGDGYSVPVRISVGPVLDRERAPIGTVSVIRDTVAERAAAHALRESEERYRSAFRSNPDAIVVVDSRRRVVDANPAATTLTGLPREHLLGSDITSLAHDDDVPKLAAAMSTMCLDGSVYLSHMLFRGCGRGPIPTELHGASLTPNLWQVLARNIEARLEAQEKLRALNDMLEEKVAARTAQLEEAYGKLERAGRMKDEFLANMSHELRTPLNSVLGLADALSDGVFGAVDEQQQQILLNMRDSGRHLLGLINEVLDLSKIEAGRLELDLRPISVSEVCQVSLRMIRPLALNKRICTSMRIDPRCPVVVADERRLKQMLVNLLSNAVKFTPTAGRVGIEAWAESWDDGDYVFFSVTDTGIGISPNDLRRIFEPFTQIDSSLSRQQDGTGLGLTLVRKLAELHKGRIFADSEPGTGSRFTIALPKVAVPYDHTITDQDSPDAPPGSLSQWSQRPHSLKEP